MITRGRSRLAIPRSRIAGGLMGDDVRGWFASTGLKMFIVLILALLPLGIIAIFGTVQTIRTAEMERLAALRLDAAQAAGRLVGAIERDRTVLQIVTGSLADYPGRTVICQRAARQLRVQDGGLAFAIYGGDGRLLCASSAGPDRPTLAEAVDVRARIDPARQTLVTGMANAERGVKAVVRYEPRRLAAMTAMGMGQSDYVSMWLSQGEARLWILRGNGRSDDRLDEVDAALNLDDIRFSALSERPQVALLRVAATLLPIFMWLAAAAIGWWVVNRFLIRPLVDLNRQVAAYQPGTLLQSVPNVDHLAAEITMLGDTFREIARDVVSHEAKLADALAHQRTLTREVHHRVKNNLQIIASLINLHSRAAQAPEARVAYASIQRRVDALSVVHRNHYAAAEYSQGIDARALVSELGGALRAHDGDGGRFPIRVDCDPIYIRQDLAVPVAFLITELTELVMLSEQPAPVFIAFKRDEDDPETMATLTVASAALTDTPGIERLLEERFGRVLTGLVRQLRTELVRDRAAGRFCVSIRIGPPGG